VGPGPVVGEDRRQRHPPLTLGSPAASTTSPDHQGSGMSCCRR
jgi:hypothetical protein